MKKEREEEKHHHFNGIFSKRHLQPPPPPSHLRSSTVTRFLPAMEKEKEDNGHSSAHYSTTTKTSADHPLPTPSSTDGASIEIIRRPRGRPAGSKNKPPKQLPVVTTESSEPSMKPCILEFPAGVDIIEATTRFCRKRKIGLCILSGNGAVTNVTLKQASSTQGSTVTFHGRFDILSISATILDSGTNVTGDGLFSLSLGVGPQGQVVGGVVIGPLVSQETIYLVAGTFNSPTFFRLQHDEEVLMDGGGESPAVVRGGVAEHNGVGSLYDFDRSIDGMWGPNARHEHAYDKNN